MAVRLAKKGYITQLELENIRAFKHLKVDLEDDGGQRMLSVIIGRNGSCKSTLLRCIALGLCNEQEAGALIAQSEAQLVREGAAEGRITLRMADTDMGVGEVDLIIESKEGRDVLRSMTGASGQYFVGGYGAGRGHIGPTPTGGYRAMDSVATLFDYRQNLVDPELMLRRLEGYMSTDQYDYAMTGIKQVLGLGPDHRIFFPKGGGVSISGPGTGEGIPLEGWADGYRITFNWIIDLYGWAMQADALTESGGIRGVLLIDEIEQHLHPLLQTELLNDLQETLPEMQVFATTHSPLVALGAGSEKIIALHRKNNDVQRATVPPLEGYSADDALVEEALFGTDPYPRHTQKKLDEYRKLAAVPSADRTRQQSNRLGQLAVELDPAKLPGLRDDPISKKLDEIADLLQKESQA